MQIAALGISGVEGARLPITLPPHSAVVSALRISPAHRGGRVGTATLAPLVLRGGAAVGLRRTDLPREYGLSIQAPGSELRADVAGPLALDFAGSTSLTVDFPVPKPIAVRA